MPDCRIAKDVFALAILRATVLIGEARGGSEKIAAEVEMGSETVGG